MSFPRRQARPNPTVGFAFEKPTRQPVENKAQQRRSLRSETPRRVERESVFRPYVDWLHADGAVCVVCGESITERIQGAHVGQGGTGKTHGSIADTIRLCGDRPGRKGCHAQHDANGTMPGFFHLWSRVRLRDWDHEQRLAHWEAFRAWAGLELQALAEANDQDLIASSAKALMECDEAISVRIDDLRSGGR